MAEKQHAQQDQQERQLAQQDQQEKQQDHQQEKQQDHQPNTTNKLQTTTEKKLGAIYNEEDSEEDDDFEIQGQVEKREETIMTRKRTREERDKQPEEKIETPESSAKKVKAFQDADAIWAEMKSTTTTKKPSATPTKTTETGLNNKGTKPTIKTTLPMSIPKKEPPKGSGTSDTLSSLFSLETKDKSIDDLWAQFNEGKPVSSPSNILEQTFSFAGENIRVASTAAEALDTIQSTNTKKGANLADLVSNLTAQPKKLSTVQKSSLDWTQFKNEKGIVDELEQAKKDGFLEKQAFLQRADLRKYQNEKNLRDQERARKKDT